MNKVLLVLFYCFSPCLLLAQTPVDTTNVVDIDTTGRKDLIDVARTFSGHKDTAIMYRHYADFMDSNDLKNKLLKRN